MDSEPATTPASKDSCKDKVDNVEMDQLELLVQNTNTPKRSLSPDDSHPVSKGESYNSADKAEVGVDINNEEAHDQKRRKFNADDNEVAASRASPAPDVEN